MILETALALACAEGLVPNVERWVRFVGARAGDVIEIQALDVPQDRGAPASHFAHATGPGAIVRLLSEPWTKRAPGLFYILNRLDPRVAGRDTVDTWHRAKRGGTSDRDIVARVVLPIDLDVVRPAGTSTSDTEIALSVEMAARVHGVLIPLIGEDAIAYGHSGNGRWLALALDRLEETKELRDLIREILAALAATFNTEQVHVDVACCDAKRLGPAWGTVKRKGVASPERPHRATGIVIPASIRRLSLDDLRALRDALAGDERDSSPPPPPHAVGPAGASPFALAKDVPIADVAAELGLVDADGSARCPRGCVGARSSVVFLGNILKCSHATCADVGPPGKGGGVRTTVDLWAEVRGVQPRAAALAICRWRGIAVPPRAPRPTKSERAAKAGAKAATSGLDLEIDVARRFVDQHIDGIRFAQGLEWYVWSGSAWVVDNREHVRELVKGIADKIREQAAVIDDDKLWSLARACGRARGIVGVLDAARSDPRIRVSPDDFDVDPWLLNCRNGIVDLRSGQLSPHDPAKLCTRTVPVDYDPNARAPRFEAFLEQILPDPDTRAFVQRQLGSASTAVIREHVLPVWYGSGSNGKSTLAELVQRVLGDYALTVTADLFMARRGDDASTRERELARLWHRRCVFASESRENRALDEATVKTITGGDTLVARQLYKDAFQFEPTHKITLRTNHKPRVQGADEGIWRRLLLVPFIVSIAEQDRDTDLKEKLWAESAGVLRWLVDGCLAWQREGLKPSRQVLEASGEYRSDMDVIGRFLDERCVSTTVQHGVFRVASAALYKAFTVWAAEQGERVTTANAFGRALSDRGLKKSKSGGENYYLGIGLRAQTDEHWSSDRLTDDDDERGRWGRSDSDPLNSPPRTQLGDFPGSESLDPHRPQAASGDLFPDRGQNGDDW